jgi:fimbrial chaperone protein
MKISNKSALVFCLVGLSSLINLPSLAFGISPIKVYFEKGSSSRDVTLDNADDKTVRLKVQAYKWTEDGDGKRQLTPTQEIAVFPAILELKPKSKRIIRLAAKLPPKQIEQSYRLAIEQLPEAVAKKPEATPDGAKPTKATAQLNFLYTLNLPVFINPINIDRKSSITSPSINGGNLSFNLVNQGNAHIFASVIEVTTKDSAGKTIATKKINPTYVLPSIQRKLTLDLPQDRCQNARSISIEIKGDEDVGNKTNLSQTVNVASGVCSGKK